MDKMLMTMEMYMPLSDMQPYPNHHHTGGQPECSTRALRKDNQRGCRTEERRDREVGPGPRRAQMPQRPDKQAQTDTVIEKPKGQCREHRKQGTRLPPEGSRESEIYAARGQPCDSGDLYRITA